NFQFVLADMCLALVMNNASYVANVSEGYLSFNSKDQTGFSNSLPSSSTPSRKKLFYFHDVNRDKLLTDLLNLVALPRSPTVQSPELVLGVAARDLTWVAVFSS